MIEKMKNFGGLIGIGQPGDRFELKFHKEVCAKTIMKRCALVMFKPGKVYTGEVTPNGNILLRGEIETELSKSDFIKKIAKETVDPCELLDCDNSFILRDGGKLSFNDALASVAAQRAQPETPEADAPEPEEGPEDCAEGTVWDEEFGECVDPTDFSSDPTEAEGPTIHVLTNPPECPPCQRAEKWFSENNIDVTTYNPENPEEAEDFRVLMADATPFSWSEGTGGIPTVLIDDKYANGWYQAQIEQHLISLGVLPGTEAPEGPGSEAAPTARAEPVQYLEDEGPNEYGADELSLFTQRSEHPKLRIRNGVQDYLKYGETEFSLKNVVRYLFGYGDWREYKKKNWSDLTRCKTTPGTICTFHPFHVAFALEEFRVRLTSEDYILVRVESAEERPELTKIAQMREAFWGIRDPTTGGAPEGLNDVRYHKGLLYMASVAPQTGLENTDIIDTVFERWYAREPFKKSLAEVVLIDKEGVVPVRPKKGEWNRYLRRTSYGKPRKESSRAPRALESKYFAPGKWSVEGKGESAPGWLFYIPKDGSAFTQNEKLLAKRIGLNITTGAKIDFGANPAEERPQNYRRNWQGNQVEGEQQGIEESMHNDVSFIMTYKNLDKIIEEEFSKFKEKRI